MAFFTQDHFPLCSFPWCLGPLPSLDEVLVWPRTLEDGCEALSSARPAEHVHRFCPGSKKQIINVTGIRSLQAIQVFTAKSTYILWLDKFPGSNPKKQFYSFRVGVLGWTSDIAWNQTHTLTFNYYIAFAQHRNTTQRVINTVCGDDPEEWRVLENVVANLNWSAGLCQGLLQGNASHPVAFRDKGDIFCWHNFAYEGRSKVVVELQVHQDLQSVLSFCMSLMLLFLVSVV